MENINKQAIISEHMRSIQKKRWEKFREKSKEEQDAYRESARIYGKKGADKKWGNSSVHE